MAGAAGNANLVRPHQLGIGRIIRIVVIAFGIPVIHRVAGKIGIFKKAEAHDAGGMAINFRVYARRFAPACHRLVNPQTILIRFGRRPETRLIDEAHGHKPVWAIARINRLEQVNQPVAFARHAFPELFVAGAPEVPRVAALDFIRGEFDAAVHRLENVRGQFGKILRAAAAGIVHRLWLQHFTAASKTNDSQYGRYC